MDPLWIALQDSAFAGLVRNSTFIYPLANIGHVLAVMVFFGAVAAMDLRLLGVLRGMPPEAVIARLRPVALFAFAVIAASGFVILSAEAVAIAHNPAFQVKFVAIALGLVNVGVNIWALRTGPGVAWLLRFSAGLSLVAWLFTAAMGRMIAYL